MRILYPKQIYLTILFLGLICAFYFTSIASLFKIRPSEDSLEALLNPIPQTSWYEVLKEVTSTYLVNSIIQASLSATIIVVSSYLLANSLKYLPPHWQNIVLTIANATFSLPTILVIYAFIAVLGDSGVFNSTLSWLGLDAYKIRIYGLTGILLANTYFNLGYVGTSIYNALNKIPPANWILSRQYRFTRWQDFKYIHWPYIKSTVINSWLLMFFICFNAFALVYFLGGGAKYANFEVAIYKSLLSEANPEKASMIGLVQIGFSVAVIGLFSLTKSANLQSKSRRQAELNSAQLSQAQYIQLQIPNLNTARRWARFYAGICIAFVVIPLGTIFYNGIIDLWKLVIFPAWENLLSLIGTDLGNLTSTTTNSTVNSTAENSATQTELYRIFKAYNWEDLGIATGYSLIFAVGSSILAIIISLALIRGWRWLPNLEKFLNNLSLISLAIPNMLLGAGFYVLMTYGLNVKVNNLILVGFIILVTAINSITYAINYLFPAYKQVANFNKLAASVKLSSWQCFIIYELPLIKKSLVYAGLNIFIMALGDFTIILFFVTDGLTSITYLISQQLNAINPEPGNITALILLTVILGLRYIVYRWTLK